MRQPQRDARQGRGADVPAAAGGGIDIRALTDADAERIGDRLPLARFPGQQTYLVAWDGDEPVAHAAITWERTKLGVPEVQDVFVLEERRRQGIGEAVMLAAERAIAEHGHRRVSLSYGIANTAARKFYERLGYRDAGIEPQRVQGTIMIRSGPLEVDDTLIYLVKVLGDDRRIDSISLTS
jgi:[ribosomal protein S18]-alanine N-acetyltransferase